MDWVEAFQKQNRARKALILLIAVSLTTFLLWFNIQTMGQG